MEASLPSFWMALEILFLSRNKMCPLRTTFVRIRGTPGILKLDCELLNAGGLFMQVGGYKSDQAWKTRSYRVPAPYYYAPRYRGYGYGRDWDRHEFRERDRGRGHEFRGRGWRR